ncbi:YncE family protein [Sphingomonas sp.]|uniref:Vgb family protein n=1 Tax=Sphingomonas sp. TaxID=28214 RepID=UPI0035BBDDCF
MIAWVNMIAAALCAATGAQAATAQAAQAPSTPAGTTVLQPREAQVIAVPGFADFLAVDGDSVWATNKGRVERWSRTGKLAEVTMAHPCGAMSIAAGSLWVADCQNGTVNRIDLKTAQLVASIPTGIANPKGELNVAAGAGAIWVASDAKGKVARIDPADNRVVASIAVDPGTFFLAFGSGALWAVSSEQQSVQRIDPATNTVVRRTRLGKQPGFLAAGEGAVWVQEQGDGTLARIDPATGAVSGRVKVGADLLYGDIDTGGGAVWLRTTADQTFVMIDPASLAIVARLGSASGSGALRYASHGLWTSAHDVHTLSWWAPQPDAKAPGTPPN